MRNATEFVGGFPTAFVKVPADGADLDEVADANAKAHFG